MFGVLVTVSEEQLRRAVDEALEPVWPNERRRASRRLVLSTLGRAALGILGFYGLALAVYLFIGVVFPLTFYAFIGGLTVVAALHEARDPEHLRHD